MKILLVRPKPKNLFNKLSIVTFEPLELEYLAAATTELGHTYVIYDGQLKSSPFADFLRVHKPDVVAITGYTIHVNIIKEYACLVKGYNDKLPVLVGGVHAELNWQDFYVPAIDVVVHANAVIAFKDVLSALDKGLSLAECKNICIFWQGQWQKNGAQTMDPNQLPFPDRSHLLAFRKQFRYFGQEECALVKTAWGCCHECNFCYCGQLNDGKYTTRDMVKVMAEIKNIPHEKIFIIDDTFLIDIGRIHDFCHHIEAEQIKKNFSIYARADFVCLHEEILPRIKAAGICEIILGLEAMDDDTLARYGKQTTTDSNVRALELLRKYEIASCALFIVDHEYDHDDFRRLRQSIKSLNPDQCMFSIFTPLRGLPEYEHYQEQLVIPSHKFEANDFLHLLLAPTKLTTFQFYLEFYRLYASSLLHPQRLRKNVGPIMRSLSSLCKETLASVGTSILVPITCKTRNVWDFWARGYDRLWVQKVSLAPTRRLLLHELREQLYCQDTLSILDVGCGTGQLVQSLLTYNEKLSVVGIDSSQKMIDAALEKKLAQATFVQGDAMQLPFADASFDIITCSHSLPYYQDQQKAITEWKRVLKPNGILLVVNASVNNMYDKAVLAMVKVTTSKAHYPSRAAIKYMLMQNGFVLQEQKSLPSSFYMPSIILTIAKGVA
ncbi:MAG: methyltransferase domain-containing protein [Firmicutes bacterium]|nr:methyltransferase domain-containing protein [Bacillota bacterium]